MKRLVCVLVVCLMIIGMAQGVLASPADGNYILTVKNVDYSNGTVSFIIDLESGGANAAYFMATLDGTVMTCTEDFGYGENVCDAPVDWPDKVFSFDVGELSPGTYTVSLQSASSTFEDGETGEETTITDVWYWENGAWGGDLSRVTVVPATFTVGGGTPVTNSTVKATLTADKTTAYEIGDTVTVTAALTPDAAAKLSSGSVKFSYDTDKLTFDTATASEALAGAKATVDNGVCTASFTTAQGTDPQSLEKDGNLVLATFKFTAKAAGTASFAVSEVVAGDENAAAMTTAKGDGVSVTINALPDVTTADFGSDYKLVKYVADALPASGSAYFLGDTALTYVPAYSTGDAAGKYVFVMLTTAEPTVTTVTEKAGSYETIKATGDANTDKATNILDSQVVIYMVAEKIKAADAGFDWLNSDVNGDSVINALDAQAIQYFVHYGQFGQFAAA